MNGPEPRHAGAMQPATAAVLLAAGGGTRWRGAGHKLTAVVDSRPTGPAVSVVQQALGRAREAGIGPVIVVTGALDDADLGLGSTSQAADDGAAADAGTVVVAHNPRWRDGQITSVHTGLRAARRLGATRVVIGLADQPFVTAAAWRSVADAEHPISVATYDGRRGNPVGLDESVWDLLPTTGDEGARALMRVRPDLVGEVPCTGSPADIDTEEDLRRWQNS